MNDNYHIFEIILNNDFDISSSINVLFILLAGCIAPNSSIKCSGQGKCETKENGQSCLCFYGFTGPYCEHSKSDSY